MTIVTSLTYKFHLFARLANAGILSSSSEERSFFLSLMRQYDPLIRRIAFSYSDTREEFEDLRQDILLNIWKGIAGFRHDSSPSTWIWRVALNTCVSTIRSRRHSVSAARDESLLRTVAAEEADEEKIEMLDLLHRAISRLSPDDKAIITMWLDEKSYEEIAELMGMNRNTVATRLRRIREHLAKEIKNQ